MSINTLYQSSLGLAVSRTELVRVGLSHLSQEQVREIGEVREMGQNRLAGEVFADRGFAFAEFG